MRAPGFEWKREDFKRQLKKSSFAPAMLMIDEQAQRDLEVYYAFCRAIDDSADDFSAEQGSEFLKQWLAAIDAASAADEPLLVKELRRLCRERGIPVVLLRELIQGAQSDLRPRVEFSTRAELFTYCHLVAGVVGQACLPIFGLGLAEGLDYAETLGRAFQLINIVRDAREDAERGRNYFALDDLNGYGSPQATASAYAALAHETLLEADHLAALLPTKPLRPSRLMRALYGELLDRMIADGVRVFEKRYRLSAPHKAWIVLRALLS